MSGTARRQLVVAAACAVVGIGLVLVPMGCHPSADVELEIRTDAFERIRIDGAAAGTARLHAQSRSATISGLDTPRRQAAQITELVLPVGRGACERLARPLRGGCGQPPRGPLVDREARVTSTRPLLVTATGAASEGLRLATAGALSSARLGTSRARVRVRCQSPWQPIVLAVDGRRLTIPRACTPGVGVTTSLRVGLRHGTERVIDIPTSSHLAATLPGHTATVVADRPILIVDGHSTVWRQRSLATTVRPEEPGGITVAMDRPGRYGTLRVTVPQAQDLHVRGHGEQLPTLLDEGRDIWIGVAGIFWGIGIAQLVGLMSGVRA